MTPFGLGMATPAATAGGGASGKAPSGRWAGRWQRAGWSAGLLAALALQAAAISTQSLTGDEPYHLLAGHQALRYGENTLNIEHPPLVKMLASLPLLAEAEPLAPPRDVTNALGDAQAIFRDPGFEARIRVRARTLLLLGVVLPWWWMTYRLGHAAGGPRAGLLLALITALSFGMLPYLTIVTTDVAVALGFAATWVLAHRFLAAPRLLTAAGMGCALGLAIAAKHSGLLLAPSLALALVLARGPRLDGRRRLGYLVVAALCAAALVEITYGIANRHYDPAHGRAAIGFYSTNHSTLIVGDRMRRYQAPLLAIEERDPRLAQWLTGVVGIAVQNALAVYPSYLFGRIQSAGRWWYFPVLFLLKSSLVLLAATLGAGVELWGRWRRRRRSLREKPPAGGPAADDAGAWLRRRLLIVLASAAALYLAVAMGSNYDLGFRHLLPVLPLLYLPAALWAARRAWRQVAVAGLLLAESLAVAPLWMSATNTWWLGPHNPTRFAAASDNCDWNQNLIVLGDASRRRRLDPLHLLDPVVSAAALKTYLPEAVGLRPGDPLPAGWYAVGVIVEQALPAIFRATPAEMYNQARYRGIAENWAPLWYQVRRGEDHGYIAGTFHLFRLAAPSGGDLGTR
jgi:Dolichyl-phosphate-mannose-protein mannosyltransferase